MSAGTLRPVIVAGILLAAVGYAATKEWQWQADADAVPLMPVAQVEQVGADAPRELSWRTEAVTAQPEQIFQD
ncbi:MAG TPA: hypothetical protein VIE41_02025 [Methylomirabilota bacterium]|jgi:hypothetical protein